MINFISNLPRDLRSGGFSAMNAAACVALSKIEEIYYAGPISPPPVTLEKLYSKMLRTCGRQGDFFFFSPRRLRQIAAMANLRCRSDATLDFFHGFTPWILSAPPRPYLAWSDCTFHDYIDIYHRRDSFRPGDLDRIERAEAAWLCHARAVGFTSRWAAMRAVERYRLDLSTICHVGIFGEVEPPSGDRYQGRKQFVFVSTDFAAKGGPAVLSAFERVRERHPDASLVVVGARPSADSAAPNVVFAGYLRKEVAEENERFRSIMAQSSALVHPTTSDITPLIIVEAAYFGCPAISVRRFAVPELIEHQVSGLLVESASDQPALADAMIWMIEQGSSYAAMRQQAWRKAHYEHSKEAFEKKLQAMVRGALGELAIGSLVVRNATAVEHQ